jgi:hypothetical protein
LLTKHKIQWIGERANQKLLLNFDELPRMNHDGKVSAEDFKILDNDVIVTRGMHLGDEILPLYYDCDFTTNANNFSGLFKDNAILRRILSTKKQLRKASKVKLRRKLSGVEEMLGSCS